MKSSYFHRVSSEMPTRMWINNPTPAEAAEAISHGAISCTTNPTYTSKMLKADSEKGTMLVHAKKAAAASQDDQEAAEILQRMATKKLLEIFLPVYEKQPGMQGFVSIQGNPFKELDTDYIIQEAMDCRRELSPNFICKIPTTKAGLIAMEEVLCEGIPVIATEVMSVSQARAVLQLWERAQSSIIVQFFLLHTSLAFMMNVCRRMYKRKGLKLWTIYSPKRDG